MYDIFTKSLYFSHGESRYRFTADELNKAVDKFEELMPDSRDSRNEFINNVLDTGKEYVLSGKAPEFTQFLIDLHTMSSQDHNLKWSNKSFYYKEYDSSDDTKPFQETYSEFWTNLRDGFIEHYPLLKFFAYFILFFIFILFIGITFKDPNKKPIDYSDYEYGYACLHSNTKTIIVNGEAVCLKEKKLNNLNKQN